MPKYNLYLTFGGSEREKYIKAKHPKKADAILMTFIDMLRLAAEKDDSGKVYLMDAIPLDGDILSVLVGRDSELATLSLNVFLELGMIVKDELGHVSISGWESYIVKESEQAEQLKQLRSKGAERTRKYREKQKRIEVENTGGNQGDVTVTSHDDLGDIGGNLLSLSNSLNLSKSNDLNDLKDRKDLKEYSERDEKSRLPFQEIMDYYNSLTGRKRKPLESIKKSISGRFKDGNTLEDFYDVFDKMFMLWWNDPKMKNHYEPETLFRASHFEKYKAREWPRGRRPDREGIINGEISGNAGSSAGTDDSFFLGE